MTTTTTMSYAIDAPVAEVFDVVAHIDGDLSTILAELDAALGWTSP